MKISRRLYFTLYLILPCLLALFLALGDFARRFSSPIVTHPGGRAMLVIDQDYGPVAAQIIDGAKKSIHFGVLRIGGDPYPLPSFEGGRWPHRESVNQLMWELVRAARRGVEVDVKLDQPGFSPLNYKSNLFAGALLEREGVNVRFDSRGSTLHSKFLVVDGDLSLVWAGNWCASSLTSNNDLGVLVQSPLLAARLVSYWESIPTEPPDENSVPLPQRVEQVLGEKKAIWPALPPVSEWPWVENIRWAVAEDRNYLPQILDLIRWARSSIFIGQSELNYGDTSDGVYRIAQALKASAGRGVEIRVILQDTTSNPWVAMDNIQARDLLRSWGIKAVLDSDRRTMHSKFLVLDERYSVIGSTNWTPGAVDAGHELSLIIDSGEFARRVIDHWKDILAGSVSSSFPGRGEDPG